MHTQVNEPLSQWSDNEREGHYCIMQKFSWVKYFVGLIFVVEATDENWPPRKFCHLDSLLDGKMAAEFRKKLCVHGYHVYNDIWETAVGEMSVCMREPRNAHGRYAMTGGNYSWWQTFCGFNFRGVEGTHENFNTMKISAYTVNTFNS